MKLKLYETPRLDLFEVRLEQTILSNEVNSVESMDTLDGEWDDEEY